MHLDRAPLTDRVHPLVGFALDIHAARLDAQDAREVGTHRILVRGELWAFEDDRRVEVLHAPAERGGLLGSRAEEHFGIPRLVSRVGVGEELPDVGQGEGTQDGVGDGVVEGIAVGVGDGTGVVREGDAAKDERSARALRRVGLEAVEVVAVPDAELAHRSDFTLGPRGGFEASDSAAGPRRDDTVWDVPWGASVLGPAWSDS